MSKKKIDGAHHVDVHVGMMLRKKRLEKGISQYELAHSVNLTFQQIQKYERGINRISCSKLHDFAKFLGTNIDYFFYGLNDYNYKYEEVSSNVMEAADSGGMQLKGVDVYQEISELIKAFQCIQDKKVRQSIINLAYTLASKNSIDLFRNSFILAPCCK